MKKPLRWLAALFLLSIPVFLVVAFVFRDAVREHVVIPVIYATWLGEMYINSIPQVFFIVGMIVIGVLLALGSLRYLLQVPQLPVQRPEVVEEPTRYQFWLKRCRKTNTSAFFLTSLGMELRRLVLMVLAYQEHRDMWDLERQIVDNKFDVPQPIFELVSQRNLGEAPKKPTFLQALLERLFGASQNSDQLSDQTVPKRLEQITSFLEYRLEVKHDRRET